VQRADASPRVFAASDDASHEGPASWERQVPSLLPSFVLVLLVFAAVALPSGPSAASGPDGRALADDLLANGPPVEISADAIEVDNRRKLFVGQGDVVVRQGDRSLRADWLAFNQRTGRGVASGNVVIESGPDTLTSRFVEFDLYRFVGMLVDGKYRSIETPFKIDAAEIIKTGEQTYTFQDGRFTTCQCPPGETDPWTIEADEAALEVEGYGTARNTTFEVLGVPLVWLPWMLYPIKTERQSGLLLPEVGYGSRNGFEVGLPIFLAELDAVNLTLTPRWLSKRGFKGDAELEWVVGEESEGEIEASYVRDGKIDAHSNSEPFGKDRWATRGKQDLFLPAELRFKTDFRFVSDNQFPTDFGGLRGGRENRFLESVGFLGRPIGELGRFGAVAGAAYADDLQSPDNLDRDDFTLQRLPDVWLYDLPGPIPGIPKLVPTFTSDYTFFFRSDSATGELGKQRLSGDGLFLDTGIDAQPNFRGVALYERDPETGDPVFNGSDDDFDPIANPRGTEGDGIFQEGEPLNDEGHRAMLWPRLGVPLRLFDLVELYPEVGWNQTLYETDRKNFEQRGQLTGRLDLRTRLRGAIGDSLTHVIEPSVGWALIQKTSQNGNPLFVPKTAVPQTRIRTLALDNITLDPADRIASFNGTTFGVTQRLYERGDPGEGARLLADATLVAGYQFNGSDVLPIYLDGRAYPVPWTATRFNFGFDPEKGRVAEGMASAVFSTRSGHQLGFSYRYVRKAPRFFENFKFSKKRFDDFKGSFSQVNQIAGAVRVALTERWAVSYRGAYTFEKELLLANVGGIEYISGCKCWSIGVEVEQDRTRGASFRLSYRLLGLGDDGDARRGQIRDLSRLGFLDGL
jgi:lipopolysaccharide assembly outer membrane protein LptD (OstA)